MVHRFPNREKAPQTLQSHQVYFPFHQDPLLLPPPFLVLHRLHLGPSPHHLHRPHSPLCLPDRYIPIHSNSIKIHFSFHPKTTESLIQWQGFVRDYNRRKLFSFIATGDQNWEKNDLRRLLSDYCHRESGSCLSVDCSVSDCVKNSSSTLIPLLESEICLQPKGESYTSKVVFECLVAGSVPVFFVKTSYKQYEWFLPGELESYSVFIEEEEVRNGTVAVKEVLQRYNKEEIRKKREIVIETIPRIIYLKLNAGIKSFEDAFDIAFDGAMERIKEEKEWVDFLR